MLKGCSPFHDKTESLIVQKVMNTTIISVDDVAEPWKSIIAGTVVFKANERLGDDRVNGFLSNEASVRKEDLQFIATFVADLRRQDFEWKDGNLGLSCFL